MKHQLAMIKIQHKLCLNYGKIKYINKTVVQYIVIIQKVCEA